MNKLYFGDNLDILRNMPLGGVDLIYMDPPFKSNKTYNLLYRNLTGRPVKEQADAFNDTWELDARKEEAAKKMPRLMREQGIDPYYAEFWRLWINALRNTQPKLLAYLIYMVQRLMWMKGILKPTGSIYLHCDPEASHYIKVMMDAIFGHQNFRNEVVWKRTNAHNSARKFGPVHDTILFYSSGAKYRWNRVYQPYDDEYIDSSYKYIDSDGRRYSTDPLTGAGTRKGQSGQPWRNHNPTSKGRHWAVPRTFPGGETLPPDIFEALDSLDSIGRIHWPARQGGVPRFKRYLDEMKGVVAQDVIGDIKAIQSQSKERLGYETQKPIALLERIIKASSNPGDVVFDPFCGCGTTVYAANLLGRKWIGCDIAMLSILLIQKVLGERYDLKEDKDYEVSGIPVSVEQAEVLFRQNPFHFQEWVVERANGFPSNRKTADRGIDGWLWFEVHEGLKDMVLSVKGGHIRPSDIRDLRGTMEREENAEMAGFLSLKEPTPAMRREAATAGVYTYLERDYPRMQLLTVKDILEDKRYFEVPHPVGAKIHKGQTNLEF